MGRANSPIKGNTVYAVDGGNLKNLDDDYEPVAAYGGGTLSIFWDAMHDDKIEPRPILTYNPEFWQNRTDVDTSQSLTMKVGEKFEKEVFRTRFRHLHYPGMKTVVLQQEGVAANHAQEDGTLFWAGSWVIWGFDHNGGIKAGVNVATTVGARPDEEEFFMTGEKYQDYEGWEEECSTSHGGLFLHPEHREN